MSRSLRDLHVYPITTRVLDVLRVVDVTPGMRRVTLGGVQLSAHVADNGQPVAAFRSDGFDDEFKLLFRHPDLDVAIGPSQADGILEWPRDPRMLMRTYTARRWDPIAGELDVDFVVHGVGPATSWAQRVQPGERIQIAGPKMSAGHPDADWALIAGDETALPAIARWLESWPEGARGQVFIEVADDSERQDLTVPDGVELTWLSRGGKAPGTTTLLYDAVTTAPWWDGVPFAWVAGEALTLAPIRRWLRGERGLTKQQIDVTGYWRRQEVVVSATDAGMPDFDETQDAGERLHERTELLPAMAIRVAVTIGLPAALAAGARSEEALARDLGVDARGLVRLVRYLISLELLERVDGGVALTEMGQGLDNDHLVEDLDLGGLRARRELAGAVSLLDAVRGTTALTATVAGLVGGADDERADVSLAASDAVYVADAIAESPALDGVAEVIVGGRSAPSVADALVAAGRVTSVRLIETPARLEYIRAHHGVRPGIVHEPGSLLEPRRASDMVLLVEAIDRLADADAVHLLRSAAASLRPGGSVVVFIETLEEATADEHDYEEDLVTFALHGSGLRSEAELGVLVERAGLHIAARTTVGWGYPLLTLVPRP